MALHVHMTWGEAMGYVGALFVFATYSMKTMIPLRAMGIASNVIMLVYASTEGLYPTLFLHGVLLPLNGVRLYQMLQLTRRVREASRGDPSMAWVKPFSTRRRVCAGELLFSKGEEADAMSYVVSGRFRLEESGIDLSPGDLVGELGMMALDSRRTQTLRCEADGELLIITYGQVRQLYFQNPTFGFYFLRLVSRRLFENHAALARRLAELQGTAAGAPTKQEPAAVREAGG
jgi:CRP/FNR family cyclic AMP-dependent transcriptional regulator